jgi:hypothetical protein
MHEATQRRLLRAAFLALCVLPTLGVLGWAVAWSLPRHAAELEDRLRDRLGLIVRFDRVTHLRPGSMRLDHLQLIDPETRQRLAEIASLHVVQTGQQLQLSIAQATLPLEQWRPLWQRLHDRVFCQDLLDGRAATFTCDRAEIRSAGQSFMLHELAGSFRHDRTSLCAKIGLRLQEPETGPPLEVTIRRVRRTTPPQTELLVDTRSKSVPLHLLPAVLTHRLGSCGRLNGRLCLSATDTYWSCRVSGDLEDVDLKKLVADESPYHLAVAADVKVNQAQFGPHGLEHAAGRCVADDGSVGRALLRSLVGHHFGSAGPALVASDPQADEFSIRELALDWRLDERGLMLRGVCPADGSPETSCEVALIGDHGPLWIGPWHPAVHAEYLIRAFIPPDLENAPEVARRLQRQLPRSAPALDRPTSNR